MKEIPGHSNPDSSIRSVAHRPYSSGIAQPAVAPTRSTSPLTVYRSQPDQARPFQLKSPPIGNGVAQRVLKAGPNTSGVNLDFVILLLNTICEGGFIFGVTDDKRITITPGNLAGVRPVLRDRVRVFGDRIGRVLTDPNIVTIDFVAGSKAVIGSFGNSLIDLEDIKKIYELTPDGTVPPIDVYSTLVHEITEQYYKQRHGMTDYHQAHNLALEREEEVSGYTQISAVTREGGDNADSTFTGVKVFTMQHIETGQFKKVNMAITNNKITGLTTEDYTPTLPGQSIPKEEKKKDDGKKRDDGKPDGGGGGKELSLVDQFLADWND